ncbi:MAG: pyridoxamine kinase [Lachnospiraceae bacterium]
MINDFTGYGHCSHAVAIPVVSVMGVQACPVPTAIFSNHMAFPTWHKYDYTPHMQDFLAAWEQLHLHFDGILCGFLGQAKQAAILASFMEKQKQEGRSLVILDPVMGDHGKLYSSVQTDYFHAIKHLLKYADIITPNITEACFLTDTPFPQDQPDETILSTIADKLHAMGPDRVVITGIAANGFFHNYISMMKPVSSKSMYTAKAGGPSRPGTGDLFASIIAADALCGVSFEASVKKAADFVRICTEGSAAANIPINEGVCFEKYLSELIRM